MNMFFSVPFQGWNDVSFHGSNQIPTPNIDALAYGGVILQNYYVDPICTPSRSALMTGYHPIHTGPKMFTILHLHYTIFMQFCTLPSGMQSGVLVGAHRTGLPLEFKLMPEYLNGLGYKSVAVGKWHLGSSRAAYTPTRSRPRITSSQFSTLSETFLCFNQEGFCIPCRILDGP